MQKKISVSESIRSTLVAAAPNYFQLIITLFFAFLITIINGGSWHHASKCTLQGGPELPKQSRNSLKYLFFQYFHVKILNCIILASFWRILGLISPILNDRWLKMKILRALMGRFRLLFSGYLVDIGCPKTYNFWSK